METPENRMIPDAAFCRCAVMLASADVTRSAEFYRDRLGFTILGVWPDIPYATVRRGGVEVHFCPPDRCKGGVYVYAEDADAAYQDVIARGAKPEDEPVDQFYGRRDFCVTDPDGYTVDISSPIPATKP